MKFSRYDPPRDAHGASRFHFSGVRATSPLPRSSSLRRERQRQKMFSQVQYCLRTNRRDASPALTAIAVYCLVKTQKRSGRLDRNVAAIPENENVAHKGKNG